MTARWFITSRYVCLYGNIFLPNAKSKPTRYSIQSLIQFALGMLQRYSVWTITLTIILHLLYASTICRVYLHSIIRFYGILPPLRKFPLPASICHWEYKVSYFVLLHAFPSTKPQQLLSQVGKTQNSAQKIRFLFSRVTSGHHSPAYVPRCLRTHSSLPSITKSRNRRVGNTCTSWKLLKGRKQHSAPIITPT